MSNTDRITHIAILSQILLNYLNDTNANNYFGKLLKMTCKRFLSELIKVERNVYDKFFDKSEDSTLVVYDTADAFYKTVSNIPIYDMENLSRIWEAYQKDKKSIEGIVKKIL